MTKTIGFFAFILICILTSATETGHNDQDGLLYPNRICIQNKDVTNKNRTNFIEDAEEIQGVIQKVPSGTGSNKDLSPILTYELGGFIMLFASTALFFSNDSLNFGYLVGNIPTLLLMFNFDEIMTVGYANVITFLIFSILFIIKQGK